jgi:tetratricopeptide (TPR) repeat protein
MVSEDIAALFLLYVKPVSAISRILDHGRLWFAIVAALGASFLVHLPQPQFQGLMTPPAAAVPAGQALVERALSQWIAIDPSSYFAPLGALALAFVPLILAIRAVSGFGSFGVLMRSDYLSLLMCSLLAWTAAYLPVAALTWMFGIRSLWIFAAASLFFAGLVALSLRTALGANLGSAFGLAALGWLGAVLSLAALGIVGSFRYYLLSPFLLYYAYSLFASDFRALGDGLRSRQHLRDQLEIATNNPRDADAHYQLGLIYQKRRQYTDAITRFESACAIDPQDADPHLQLGRIALDQGRWEDAVEHLKNAAALDDKASLSEVWRDLGSACFRTSRWAEAAAALEKYAARRPYDAEGLYWLGRTHTSLGHPDRAREYFEQCIEAVKTAPGHRRAHIREWARQAQSALRALK